MRFELNVEDRSIFGELQYDEKSTKLLVLTHGFKGYYSWGFFPEVQKRFLAQGYAVLSFNFSCNGVYRHQTEITSFTKFSNNNFSIEQSDFDCVLEYVKSKNFPVKYDSVYGIGHSRGGSALLLAASRHHLFFDRIATWSAVSDIHNWLPNEVKSLLRNIGYLEVVNGRTGDVLKVNYQFQKDLDLNYEALDILKNIGVLDIPICVIHGDADETVDVSHGLALSNAALDSDSELIVIKSATHTYNFDLKKNRLPWQLNEVINRSLMFFLR